MSWPEVTTVHENKRYELVLSGQEISDRLQKSDGQLDPAIFKLKQINFLEITRTSLSVLSSDVSQLINLTTLTLTSNKLRDLCPQLAELRKMKHFNASYNELEQIPDQLFTNWLEIETINLSHNRLTQLCPFPKGLHKLAVLNLAYNQFQEFPQLSTDLDNLSTLDISSNQLVEIPKYLSSLTQLKLFQLDNNQIKEIPVELSQCVKLKELRFKNNPLKDNRLKKLMEQDKLKAVLEYLEKDYVEQQKSLQKDKSKGDKSKTVQSTVAIKKTGQQQQPSVVDKIHVMYFDEKDLKGRQITLLPRVLPVRPHILCCIVRQIDLKTPGNLKKFLNLQNEIHDELCVKRTLATIATHDLNLIKGNLIYDAHDPDEIGFIPLGRNKLISARDYYDQLCKDAEQERKAKKRNQLSGLNKYLTLLTDQQYFPCLADSERFVISLPPLTNAERTKMTAQTQDILIEITSSNTIDACKRVMDELLRGMLKIRLGKQNEKLQLKVPAADATVESRFDVLSTDDDDDKDDENEEDDTNGSQIRQTLILQQTRIVDQNGALKTVYPSRTDLEWVQNDPSMIIERTVE